MENMEALTRRLMALPGLTTEVELRKELNL